jgi:hypothetical protein
MTLQLDVLEAERLRLDLLEPWLHQERRVERVAFLSQSHFRMDVFQQVWSRHDANAQSRLVSLGIYSKSRRPTLRVSSASGAALPVLSRTEQAKVLGYLYFQGIASDLVAGNQGIDAAAIKRFAVDVRWYIERIVSAPTARAEEALTALKSWVGHRAGEDPVAKAFLEMDDAWTRLGQLTASCQVLARVPETTDQQLVLTHSYSQELPLNQRSPEPEWSPRATFSKLRKSRGVRVRVVLFLRLVRNLLASIATRLLIRLGVLPVVIGRRCQNADHCESFYLLVEEAPGTTCQRNYWQALEPKRIEVPAGVDVASAARMDGLADTDPDLEGEWWHSDIVCFASHSLVCDTTAGENRAYIELRPSRGRERYGALLLSMTAVYVSAALARDWYPTVATESLATLFLAVPGALTALMMRDSSSLSKQLSNGLVFLAYLAGGAAFLMAASTPVTEPESVLRTWTPMVAAVSSTMLALLLVWILTISRAFDGPRRPVATLDQARRKIQAEKIVASLYIVGCAGASGWLALYLWP